MVSPERVPAIVRAEDLLLAQTSQRNVRKTPRTHAVYTLRYQPRGDGVEHAIQPSAWKVEFSELRPEAILGKSLAPTPRVVLPLRKKRPLGETIG